MRLFVAIALPEPVQQQLAQLRRELAGARWVRPEQLHLTLAFLGEVAEERLEQLTAALGSIRYQPFALQFDRLGCFPNQRHPRVVWIGLQPNPELQRLAQAVQAAVTACGISLEERPFHPHITLARLKQADPRQLAALLTQQPALPEVAVATFLLFQSRLSVQGAEHRVLRRFVAPSHLPWSSAGWPGQHLPPAGS